jgi:hypothetical protein
MSEYAVDEEAFKGVHNNTTFLNKLSDGTWIPEWDRDPNLKKFVKNEDIHEDVGKKHPSPEEVINAIKMAGINV